ncbi:hypothetical protein ACFSR7_16125 [Cohnella sp. GCM10020058]|uniref:hypothetical protein n=1 Tax=Cohnella sp. GCM10020058 TaxID=3317330 RepID=UPI00363A69EC
MLNKFTAIILSITTIFLCMMLFEIMIRGETDATLIVGFGLVSVMYTAPFVFVAGIISLLVDKLIKSRFKIAAYLALGTLFSLLSIIIFRVSQQDTILFIILTGIVSSSIMYISRFVKSKIINLLVVTVIPVLYIILLVTL